LLLACIAWGATAEFTHNHGSPSPIRQIDSATRSAEVASTSIGSSNNGRTSSSSRSKADCLICQLHQNLSTSEINHASVTGAAESQHWFTQANVAVHLSEFADTRRGRAPPIIL
jgi:hypothetical protein